MARGKRKKKPNVDVMEIHTQFFLYTWCIMKKNERLWEAIQKLWFIDMELKWSNVVEKLSIIHWDDSSWSQVKGKKKK